MTTRDKLVQFLNEELKIDSMEDSSANGLQVQGASEVHKVALATDAALAVYQRAHELSCEMIVTHHGIIWGNGLRAITGRYYEHLSFLLEHKINLYAAHLPIDAHPTLGNNAELARLADLRNVEPFGTYRGAELGFWGTLPQVLTPDELADRLGTKLGGTQLVLPFGPERMRSIGIVSGGGSSALTEAIARGLDCLVTGEGKHEDHHLALEGGINVIYLGHYESETVGVKALGRRIGEVFDVETVFVDVPTLI